MRLALVLVFTALGIVARSEPKPEANLITVKGHVAVKIKSESTGTGPIAKTYRAANQIVSSRLNRRQEFVKCESAAYWSAIDEIVQGEVQGEVRAEGEKVYSYCAEKGSDGGRSPHYPDGPDNVDSGNYVDAAVKNYGSANETVVIDFVKADRCRPKPENCNCKSLLERVVSSFPKAATIEIQCFIADPALYGCLCYLGTAARHGFKSVELKKCRDPQHQDNKDPVVDFNANNYRKKCEEIEKRECAIDGSDWLIRKK